MDCAGGKLKFAAACGFLMLLPSECVPDEAFEATSVVTKGHGKLSAHAKEQADSESRALQKGAPQFVNMGATEAGA